MTPRRQLSRLQHAFLYRLDRLRLLALAAKSSPAVEQERMAGYIAIELVNTWDTYVRSSYLSIKCGAVSAGGSRIQIASGYSPNHDVALRDAALFFKPNLNVNKPVAPLDEPNWFDPATLTRLSRKFGFSNEPQILNAFSYPTTAWKNLKTFRNFFAHKDKQTMKKATDAASRLLAQPVSRPSQALILIPRSAAASLVEEWLHDVRTVGAELVK